MRRAILIITTLCVWVTTWGQSVKVPHYKTDTVVGYYELEYDGPDSVSDGLVTAIYPGDSTIGLTKNYRNGQLNGLMEIYHPNGNLHIKAFYSQGKLNGVWEEWDKDGNLIIKCFYKEGVRHGRWSYVPKMHRGKYKNGKKHGRWKVKRDDRKYVRRYKRGNLKYERRGFWWR